MKIQEFEKKMPTMKKEEFMNEYGEKFNIFFDGITVYFGGDETDQNIQILFNNSFNIFSKEELKLLGNALISLAK